MAPILQDGDARGKVATAREAARRLRVQTIIDAGKVRAALGQGARHRLLPDGSHEIIVSGRTATAATVAEAIDQARGYRP
jgi:hypothetical protein